MKVLVTGSRDWPWAERKIIEDALRDAGATVVVHGNARGADSVAKWWALDNGIEYRAYPANWDLYGRAAGALRNQEMLDKEHRPEEPIERVLAFPTEKSVGTMDMIRRAREVGLRVTEYYVGPAGMFS